MSTAKPPGISGNCLQLLGSAVDLLEPGASGREEWMREQIADLLARLHGRLRLQAIREWMEADAQAREAAAAELAERETRRTVDFAYTLALATGEVEVHRFATTYEGEFSATVRELVRRADDLWRRIPSPRSSADFQRLLRKRAARTGAARRHRNRQRTATHPTHG